MEIKADALPRHLTGTLKFAYLLAGEEQLLVQEAHLLALVVVGSV